MRATHAAALLPFLALGCVAADIGAGEDPGLDEIELAADNGIFLDNGLNLTNGMNLGNGTTLANGMNLGNGIDVSNGMNLGNGLNLGNGITGPFYAPPAGSGLEQWIDVDPPMRTKILRYLVECALPAGVPVQLQYRGALRTLGSGILGLGPSLRRGLLPVGEQEAVSGCMLARMNGWGDTVQLDLFGPFAGLDTWTAADEPFDRFEAAYYGNLFDLHPTALVCTENVLSCEEMRGCRELADGTCDCGVFTPGTPGQLDCFNGAGCGYEVPDPLRGLQYFVTGCGDASSASGWWSPMTVWIASRPAGASCRYDNACASYVCNAGVCQ